MNYNSSAFTESCFFIASVCALIQISRMCSLKGSSRSPSDFRNMLFSRPFSAIGTVSQINNQLLFLIGSCRILLPVLSSRGSAQVSFCEERVSDAGWCAGNMVISPITRKLVNLSLIQICGALCTLSCGVVCVCVFSFAAVVVVCCCFVLSLPLV